MWSGIPQRITKCEHYVCWVRYKGQCVGEVNGLLPVFRTSCRPQELFLFLE